VSKDKNWIDERLREAKKVQPTVTDGAAIRVKNLINGSISERPLSSTELMNIAKALLADMIPASPKAATQ
jgi:hypothetical protein